MPETSELGEIIAVVKLCAQIVLESGGETYRAEETVTRICKALGYEETDIVAIPTGVFITVCKDGVNLNTAVKRIKRRKVNLSNIESVNNISRQLINRALTIEEALMKLRELRRQNPGNQLLYALFAGLSSGFFTLLFRGNLFDFIASAVIGTIVQYLSSIIRFEDMFNFAVGIIGGLIIGIGSVLSVTVFGMGDLQKIITGAMMPLLPGIEMTNAIRDTMRGDLLSGVSRAAEALLIAISLAFGVGVVLRIYYYIGG